MRRSPWIEVLRATFTTVVPASADALAAVHTAPAATLAMVTAAAVIVRPDLAIRIAPSRTGYPATRQYRPNSDADLALR